MEALRAYLKGLSIDEQRSFAARAGTTIGYLRKALSVGQSLGASIVIALERESHGAVRAEQLRPDIEWAVIRGSAHAA